MSIGVILSNLGTPDAPTPSAVRKYLAEFLSDPRVIEIPKIFWWPILYGIILPFRSAKSAKLYQKIWTDKGSPLRAILEEQVEKLDSRFRRNDGGGRGNNEESSGNDGESSENDEGSRGNEVVVVGAMRYGQPSIESAIHKLCAKKIKKIIILPLYPQYSAATTATTFDEVARVFKSLRAQPELHMINSYYNHPDYISAVAESIRSYWIKNSPTEKLLFSFHGLPQSFIDKGDPYYDQCLETARLVSEQLELKQNQWLVSFQSRLGRAQWLKPYTDITLQKLASEEKIKSVSVVCPGFSADCLETLEEINILNREVFIKSGGERFYYLPALNSDNNHIEALAKLIEKYI